MHAPLNKELKYCRDTYHKRGKASCANQSILNLTSGQLTITFDYVRDGESCTGKQCPWVFKRVLRLYNTAFQYKVCCTFTTLHSSIHTHWRETHACVLVFTGQGEHWYPTSPDPPPHSPHTDARCALASAGITWQKARLHAHLQNLSSLFFLLRSSKSSVFFFLPSSTSTT